MSQTNTHTPLLALGIFKCLEAKGWRALTLHDVASEAQLSLEELHEFATSKEDLMALTISYIEEETLAFVDESTSENTSKEDHLFDVLFARFEAATPHKAALKRLWQDLKATPTDVRPLMPLFLGALRRVAILGDLDFDGPLGAIQLRAFGLIYLRLLHVWLEDETPDLAKTMSETNKAVTKYIPCLFDPFKVLNL